MARLLVFQHSPWGTPGRLGVTLRDHGFRLDIRRMDLHREIGRGIPPDYDDVHGVVVLGGPQNVGDPDPWIAHEIAYIRGAHERALPVVGICLGCQMIAKALGGDVAPMARPELGYSATRITVPGQTETILAGVPWEFAAFQSHGQEVTKLPPGATILAESDACRVQAFRAGLRTYAFQFHFEVDRPMISAFIQESARQARALGTTPTDLERQADEHDQRSAVIADRLCDNLATYCFPTVGLVRA